MGEGFEITPGDENSSVILHVPHSSTRIPADVRAGIVLSDAELNQELLRITDSFTDKIAAVASSASPITPWIFRNDLSRLVIDPERGPARQEHRGISGFRVVVATAAQQARRGCPV